MTRVYLTVILALIFMLMAVAQAQTTINPDLSLIGEIRSFSHNDESRADESEKLNLSDPEMELMISGYLNPYARADAVIAWHTGTQAEIEEIYATIMRGLPLDINLRAGKYLLEFGRLNPVHPHAWSFMERPLPHEHFFGDHGLSDMAIRASVLLPTGETYTELMGALLKGDALAGHHHHDEEEEEHEESDERADLGFFGRLATSLATGEHSELAVGVSCLNAVPGAVEHHHEEELGEAKFSALFDEHEESEAQRSWIVGGDVKYKYRPSRYTALQIEGEVLLRRDKTEDGDALTSSGGYAYLDYRFLQKYNIGGIFEYARLKEAAHHDHEEAEPEISVSDIWRAGLFVGFAPVEETSLVRLAGHWTKAEGVDGFWEVNLQFVFSLGPHKPHNF